MADKKVRDEVAALAAVIEELRGEVAALRLAAATHHCHGCGCFHYHYTPVPWYPNTTYPVVTYCNTPEVTYSVSNVAAGGAAGGVTTYTLSTTN